MPVLLNSMQFPTLSETDRTEIVSTAVLSATATAADAETSSTEPAPTKDSGDEPPPLFCSCANALRVR